MNKILVDGLNVFLRHYAANPSMSKNGYQIGAIVGFLNNLKELINLFKPEEIVVVWESGGSSRRRAINSDYKSGRRPNLNRFYDEDEIPDTKENMGYQLSQLIKLLKCMPVKQVFIKNSEGDDAIAVLTKNFIRDNETCSVIIVSTDRDFYQLISDNVKQWSLNKKKLIDVYEVKKEYGVHPNNLALCKAIIGDKGDNVEGLSGIGVGRIKKKFDFLLSSKPHSFLDCVEKLKDEKIKKRLIVERDKIIKNIKLVSLDFGSINHDSVAKINWAYNNPETTGSKNKIGFYRILNVEGINTFDVENLFMIINQIGKR